VHQTCLANNLHVNMGHVLTSNQLPVYYQWGF